jgi:tetratricopeptide (TPR) repeat protein
MANVRIAIIAVFLLIFISTALVHTVSAQENITKETPRQEDKIVTSQNATFQEFSQSSEVEKENIIEAQRSFDRSLDILNVVTTLMGVLVGLIGVLVALLTLIIVIAVATGVFEYRKWKVIIKYIEKEANRIRELRNNAESDTNILRNEVEKFHTPITEKPPEELKKTLDELTTKLEFIEKLGVSLKPMDYFNRGVDFFYKSQYELALKAFEKVIELKPDHADAWNNKGATLDKLGRHEESLKAFEKVIELKPDDADAWYNKGATLDKLGRHEESLKASGKAIELKPDRAGAWNNKGVVLNKLGRHEESLKAFEKVIELKPDDADAWNNKGAALDKLGRHEESLKAFEKAIELKPDHAGAWYNHACGYSMKGDKEKALSDLKKAIELDISHKEEAKEDKDFEKLWDDEDFKKLVE